MRALGVDYGERRIGLAVSDPSGTLAFPLDTLPRRNDVDDLQALRSLIEEREIEQIVVGLPRRLDGSLGAQAKSTQAFVSLLERELELPVATVDERFTTRIAEDALRATGRRGHGKRAVKDKVDAVAASLLLRTWLEQRAAGSPR